MKRIYKIDKNGYLLFGEDKFIGIDEELPGGFIGSPLPENSRGELSFYRPKWDSGRWVEDITQEEIDALNNQPRGLSEIELIKLSQANQFETILEILGGLM